MAIGEMQSISEAYNIYLTQAAAQLGLPIALIAFFLIVVSIWSLCWKGVALWKTSQKKKLLWFIILLVVNTVGILEILYIFVFSKMDFKAKNAQPNSSSKVLKKKK